MITRLKNGQKRHREMVLDWLRANPGYHFGLNIAASSGVGRSRIYIHLGSLEEAGLVERVTPEKFGLGMPRPMYRAALVAKAQGSGNVNS